MVEIEDAKLLKVGKKIYYNGVHVKRRDFVSFSCIKCGKVSKFQAFILKKDERLICGNCKRMETNVSKYGVDNPLKDDNIKTKVRQTHLKKYGEWFNNRDKAVSTVIKRYGVENVSQVEEFKLKKKNVFLERYGIEHNFSNGVIRDKISKKKKFNFFKSLTERNNGLIKPLFDIEEYVGGDFRYNWECNTCGNIFEDRMNDGYIPRCPVCFPKNGGVSKYEKQLIDWLKSFNVKVVENNRKIIPPQELDIYLPDYNLAIEFNGLYWHSELNGKDRNYHLNKTLECEKQGIELIHIFEDEWIEKQEIVKSIIKSKLGLIYKVFGRKSNLEEIYDKEVVKTFLDENHLQGFIKSVINLGLYYNKDLISVLTFGKPRYSKSYDWEILRFANKKNLSVIGGFAKLMKYFKDKYGGSIITYSDARIFNGSVYQNNGFKQLELSNPGYYYFKPGLVYRYNRMKFQKHKLEEKLQHFDPNLTEWENMQMNGWDRIWDCGNYKFSYIEG